MTSRARAGLPWLALGFPVGFAAGLIVARAPVATPASPMVHVAEPAPPPPVVSGSRPQSASETPQPDVPTEPAPIPQAVLDAAVDDEIARRAARAFEAQRRRAEDEGFARIGQVVDRWVLDADWDDHDAAEVEIVLQDELDQTWAIKEATASGQMDGDEGKSAWLDLRSRTDQALADLLGEDDAQALRAELDGRADKPRR